MTADISISDSNGGAGLVYNPLSPCRIIDTRSSQGGAGPISGGTQRNFSVTSLCGIPSGATKAVSINIAATNAVGTGNLRAFAWPGAVPSTAILNYGMVPGLTAIGNAANVPICDADVHACSWDLSIWVSRTTDIIVDVLGYFTA